MSINLFERRTMDEALKIMKEPKTFLLNTFFKKTKEFDTKHVDIDVFDGKRRRAPYIRRRTNSTPVEKQGFDSSGFVPPYISLEMPTEAEEQFKRSIGQPVYSGESALQVAANQLAEDMADLDNQIVRTEEIQASQALFDDDVEIHDIDGKEVEANIQYGRKASHAFSAAPLWNAAGSDPLQDIRTGKRLIVQDAGVVGTDIVMGADALDAFLANQEVKDALNLRRANLAEFETRAIELGVMFYGMIEGGTRIWSYDEWYFDEILGDEREMVPKDKVLIASSEADMRRLYGAVKNPDGMLVKAMRMPDTWVEKRTKDRIIQIQSAPLVVPTQVNSTAVITVV